MLWIVKKEMLYHWRYKMTTLNLLLTPFFTISPYLLVAGAYGMESRILGNMILWFWLCQELFSISNGIAELRQEGTFPIIFMTPHSLFTYLFSKYLAFLLDNSAVTVVTLLLTRLFLGITVAQPFHFALNILFSSFFFFAFCLLWIPLLLKYKKVSELILFLQQSLGALSGYTNPQFRFPPLLRFFSYLIPLTYSILWNQGDDVMQSVLFGDWRSWLAGALLLLYLGLGCWGLRKAETALRKRGDIEQW